MQDTLSSVHEVTDLCLWEWYSETCVVRNALRTVQGVLLPQCLTVAESLVEEMEVDQEPEEDGDSGVHGFDEDFTELFDLEAYPELAGSPLPDPDRELLKF